MVLAAVRTLAERLSTGQRTSTPWLRKVNLSRPLCRQGAAFRRFQKVRKDRCIVSEVFNFTAELSAVNAGKTVRSCQVNPVQVRIFGRVGILALDRRPKLTLPRFHIMAAAPARRSMLASPQRHRDQGIPERPRGIRATFEVLRNRRDYPARHCHRHCNRTGNLAADVS